MATHFLHMPHQESGFRQPAEVEAIQAVLYSAAAVTGWVVEAAMGWVVEAAMGWVVEAAMGWEVAAATGWEAEVVTLG